MKYKLVMKKPYNLEIKLFGNLDEEPPKKFSVISKKDSQRSIHDEYYHFPIHCISFFGEKIIFVINNLGSALEVSNFDTPKCIYQYSFYNDEEMKRNFMGIDASQRFALIWSITEYFASARILAEQLLPSMINELCFSGFGYDGVCKIIASYYHFEGYFSEQLKKQISIFCDDNYKEEVNSLLTFNPDGLRRITYYAPAVAELIVNDIRLGARILSEPFFSGFTLRSLGEENIEAAKIILKNKLYYRHLLKDMNYIKDIMNAHKDNVDIQRMGNNLLNGIFHQEEAESTLAGENKLEEQKPKRPAIPWNRNACAAYFQKPKNNCGDKKPGLIKCKL